MGRMSLPPGFRFHPTDTELIMFYLKRKVVGKKLRYDAVTELDIYMFCPWDLPDKCLLKSKDLEWYFFSPSKKKYGRGARTNRATENGYWKATGKDRPVIYNQRTVGMIKTLIFHTGHAPKGERTDWVMHEYRLEDETLADVVQDTYRLCKVFQKSGLGPQIGAHYGAPFNEEEWSDAEEICVESLSVVSQILSDRLMPSNKMNSDAVSLKIPGNLAHRSTSEPEPSTDRHLDINNMHTDMEKINVESPPIDSQVLCNYVPPSDVGSVAAMNMTLPGVSSGWCASKSCPSTDPSTSGPPVMDIPCIASDLPEEDFNALLDMFVEGSFMPDNNCNKMFENIRILPCLNENGICNDLGDLNDAFHLNPVILRDDAPFLELDDLNTPLRHPTETGQFNVSQRHDAAYNLNLQCDDTPFLELIDLDSTLRCPAETGQFEWIHTDNIHAAHAHDRSMGINGSYFDGDNPSSLVNNVSGWNEPSALLERSDLLGNSFDYSGLDNCIGNFEAQEFYAVSQTEFPFSSRGAEGNSTGDQMQRRGEQQTKLQLLLESVSAQLAELLAHVVRAEQLNDSFTHIASSIHFKAEVTLKSCECTKDALLHNMEESRSVFSTLDYLPTEKMKNTMPTSSIFMLRLLG